MPDTWRYLDAARPEHRYDTQVLHSYVAVENEPSPKLIVDPPLPEGLAQGVFWAQYRWLAAHYPQVPFERYADDVIAHCRT
jgi:hypothetical protein